MIDISTLERSGSYRYGICPYCASSAQTLIVMPDDSYRCMSCGRAGIIGEEPVPQPKQQEQTRLYKLNATAMGLFQRQLYGKYGAEGMDYLSGKRKLTDDTIKAFRLGYARFSPYEDLKKHFSDEEMIASGLFKANEDGTLWFQLKGRVIYPIFDAQSRVIGFGGRVLDNSEPKYKNSPETAIFSKREHLYAWDKAVASKKSIPVLCEGYMDVISMHQAGLDSAVASLGTALTDEQARLIKSVSDKCVLLYDTDVPGQKATERAISVLKKAGVEAYVSNTLPAKDPDEFLKTYRVEELKKRLRRAMNEQEYRLRMAKRSDGEVDFEKTADILLEAEPERAEKLLKKLTKI